MAWQLAPLTLPLAVSGVLGLVVAALIWRERPKDGATWLSLTALAFVAWAAGQVVVVSQTTPSVRLLGSGVTVVGMVFVPPLWLLFSLGYTGRADWMSRPVLGVLLVEPVVLGSLALAGHPFVFAEGTLAAGAAGATLFEKYGPLMIAQHAWGYTLLFVAEYVLFEMFLGSRNVFRKRTFFFLALIVTLHVSQFLSVAGLSPTPYQTLTPLGFLLFGILSVGALVSYRSFEFLPLKRILAVFGRHSKSLAPIARERAIEEMGTGFMVIDHAGRIVDINPMGKRILAREGDRARLRRAFENLVRNAVEHGGADVTLTVGDLDGGFYVADDGPGIPPEHREDVLEEGFTTDENGTGFGLAIIQTIVEAHGWTVTVTESADGGARFEITGDSITADSEVPAPAD